RPCKPARRRRACRDRPSPPSYLALPGPAAQRPQAGQDMGASAGTPAALLGCNLQEPVVIVAPMRAAVGPAGVQGSEHPMLLAVDGAHPQASPPASAHVPEHAVVRPSPTTLRPRILLDLTPIPSGPSPLTPPAPPLVDGEHPRSV